ncbi:lysoplasmalogenase family protein [Erythrobacter sp. GH1-10]|uniref:lysoplasmalogenase family protein n=1 Tax=Erythrobacter sp. GH1-10 TaxID=3349334 RepID=UPI003877B3B3
MPKRALIDQRPWLLASVAAAIAFYFLRDNPIGGLYLILLKGAGVGLLAVYAFYRTKGLDGALIVLVLSLASAADMALEIDFTIGGGLFLASHLVALGLYLRNRRESTSASQKLLALALAISAPAISWLLSGDPMIALYAVSLGAMAAAAWMSRFPRYRVGIGAVLFVVSDWLIFSAMGPLDLAPLPEILIWPLYYAGMLMIATGVVQTLRGEQPAK